MKAARRVLVLVLGACLLTACGTGQSPPATGSNPSPQRPSAVPSSSPDYLMSGSCNLGYLSGNYSLLPRLTTYAGSATAASVTLTNLSSTGITLTGFELEILYHGQVIVTNQVTNANGDGGNSGYGLPMFMTAGQVYSQTVELDNLPNVVNVSFDTYLHSTCKISRWFHA